MASSMSRAPIQTRFTREKKPRRIRREKKDKMKKKEKKKNEQNKKKKKKEKKHDDTKRVKDFEKQILWKFQTNFHRRIKINDTEERVHHPSLQRISNKSLKCSNDNEREHCKRVYWILTLLLITIRVGRKVRKSFEIV